MLLIMDHIFTHHISLLSRFQGFRGKNEDWDRTTVVLKYLPFLEHVLETLIILDQILEGSRSHVQTSSTALRFLLKDLIRVPRSPSRSSAGSSTR